MTAPSSGDLWRALGGQILTSAGGILSQASAPSPTSAVGGADRQTIAVQDRFNWQTVALVVGGIVGAALVLRFAFKR